RSLSPLLDGLQKLGMLLLPVEQRSGGNANPSRRLCGKPICHRLDDAVAVLPSIQRRSTGGPLSCLYQSPLTTHAPSLSEVTPHILHGDRAAQGGQEVVLNWTLPSAADNDCKRPSDQSPNYCP